MQLDRRNTSNDPEAELDPNFFKQYKIETSFKHISR